MAGVATHWLRGNASEWSPSRVIFLDTETRSTRSPGLDTLGLRLWVGASVDRRQPRKAGGPSMLGQGFDRASLARWVDGQTIGSQTTWLYAHNLGFDLTVSRLPDQLHRLGWRMSDWGFAGRNVSGRMTKGSKRLALCDSVSLLPHSLEEVGRRLGHLKAPMPAPEASDDDWLAYCLQDVLVTAEAVLTVLDWWDRERLGHWTISGPGCGWNALRHRHGGRAILIDTDAEGLASDRKAIRGGRRGVTRVGPIPGGPFALVDFKDAYLTVVAHCLLPKGRRGTVSEIAPGSSYVFGNRFGVVADCVIDTPVPAYPFRTDRGVFYPTGQFVTPLCSPEIEAARQAGHLVSIQPGWVHDMGFALQPWARWCLDQLAADDDVCPPVVKMMVKQWGRSVPGKFAARASQKVDLGPALWPGWHLERGTTGPQHDPAADVHIGGRHWWYRFDLEGENAYPAVLAFVESYVRVALSAMLRELTEELWVCADTDGCVIDLTRARSWLRARGASFGRIRSPMTIAEAVCEAVRPVCWPLVPRVKMLSETLTVIGPQHYSGDTFDRAAGRPGKPEKDQNGEVHWWRWPRVAWQMAEGSKDGFVRVEGNWTAPAQLAHRWVLEDGTTVPVRTRINGAGATELLPWDGMVESLGERQLARVQAPVLSGLYGPTAALV